MSEAIVLDTAFIDELKDSDPFDDVVKKRDYSDRFLGRIHYEAVGLLFKNDIVHMESLIEDEDGPIGDPILMFLNGESCFLRDKLFPDDDGYSTATALYNKSEEIGYKFLDQKEQLLTFLGSLAKSNLEFTSQELHNWRVCITIFIADGILSKARMQLERDDYAFGCWNLSKAWKLYERIVDENFTKDGKTEKLNKEVTLLLKYSLAIFFHQASCIPPNFYLLNAVSYFSGFEYNFDLSTKFMFEVFNEGGFKKNYSALFLLNNFLEKPGGLMENSLDEKQRLELIKPIVTYCHDNFPENSHFRYYYALYLRKLGKFEEAIQVLWDVLKTIQNKRLLEPPKFLWELANDYIALLDWKNAISILERTKKFSFLATLQLSNAYQMIGDHGKALFILTSHKKVPGRLGAMLVKSIQDLQSKQFAIALYTITLEVLYFKGYFPCIPEKKLTVISKHFAQLAPKAQFFLTSVYALQAILFRYTGKEREAKQMFEKVSVIPEKHEQHWVVVAHLELAEIAFNANRPNLVTALLERIKKMFGAGYEWEDNGYLYLRYQKYNWDMRKKKDPNFDLLDEEKIVGIKKITHRIKTSSVADGMANTLNTQTTIGTAMEANKMLVLDQHTATVTSTTIASVGTSESSSSIEKKATATTTRVLANASINRIPSSKAGAVSIEKTSENASPLSTNNKTSSTVSVTTTTGTTSATVTPIEKPKTLPRVLKTHPSTTKIDAQSSTTAMTGESRAVVGEPTTTSSGSTASTLTTSTASTTADPVKKVTSSFAKRISTTTPTKQ